MKTTSDRLREIYCIPLTKDECWRLGVHFIYVGVKICQGWDGKLAQYIDSDRTEVPVSDFIDVLVDAIVAWRLLEDGFRAIPWKCTTAYEIDFAGKRSLSIIDGAVTVWNDEDDSASKGVPMIGIRTYTDLLTQIRFLG